MSQGFEPHSNPTFYPPFDGGYSVEIVRLSVCLSVRPTFMGVLCPRPTARSIGRISMKFGIRTE